MKKNKLIILVVSIVLLSFISYIFYTNVIQEQIPYEPDESDEPLLLDPPDTPDIPDMPDLADIILDIPHYRCAGHWSLANPCTSAYDENWNSWGVQSSDDDIGILYINYIKPRGATKYSKWQVGGYLLYKQKQKIYNMSIPDKCWDRPILQFRAISRKDEDYLSGWYCWDGSIWVVNTFIRGKEVYEEGMWWDIKSDDTYVCPKRQWIYQEDATSTPDTECYEYSELTIDKLASVIRWPRRSPSEQAEIINELELTIPELTELISKLRLTDGGRALLISKLDLDIHEQIELINSLNLNVEDTAKLINTLNLAPIDELILINDLQLTDIERQELKEILEQVKIQPSKLWILIIASIVFIIFISFIIIRHQKQKALKISRLQWKN